MAARTVIPERNSVSKRRTGVAPFVAFNCVFQK